MCGVFMEDKINISEMKKIAKEIIASESKKYGIDINARPIVFADIINPKLFKGGNYTIDKRSRDLMNYTNLRCGGYNNSEGTAVIYLDRFLHRNISSIFLLSFICYHEARHSFQQHFDRYSYDRFLYDIEKFYRRCDLNRDYQHNHDSYSFEIGANLYGVQMAKEYLKNNYPDIYEKEHDKIVSAEIEYKNDYQLYNPSYTIDRVMPFLKVFKSLGINNVSPVLSIFLNYDGSFKRPSEVMANEKYQELDKRIVYAFFSSLSFMKELSNMQDLLPEEVNIINEAIDYTSNICNNQLNNYNNKMKQVNNSKDFLIRKKLQLIYMKLFFTRYRYLKKQFMSLNNSKEQINGRSKGYLSVYLLSLIISIGTIIFIYIKK